MKHTHAVSDSTYCDKPEVNIHTPIDRKLCKLARLQARMKTRIALVAELPFTANIALIVHNLSDLLEIVDMIAQMLRKIAL